MIQEFVYLCILIHLFLKHEDMINNWSICLRIIITLIKKSKNKNKVVFIWHSQTENSTKALTYRLFKDNIMPESYLEILDSKNAIILCKFRTTNHRLPIEIGRWQNIERNNRICLLYDTNTIGDEFHYILQCRYFEHNCKNLIPSYFRNRPNVLI